MGHVHWLLPEDELMLFCNVTRLQDSFNISDECTMPGIQVPRHMMEDELGEFWKNFLFTECCLVAAG